MDTEDPKMERIARLDTYRLKMGWTQQRLINPTKETGCRYGVVPLPQDSSDEAKFLIFGGLSGLDNIFRTMLLETKIADFSDTRYTELPLSDVFETDSYNQNHFFPIPEDLLTDAFLAKYVDQAKRTMLKDVRQPRSHLVGVLGYEGLHLFD